MTHLLVFSHAGLGHDSHISLFFPIVIISMQLILLLMFQDIFYNGNNETKVTQKKIRTPVCCIGAVCYLFIIRSPGEGNIE